MQLTTRKIVLAGVLLAVALLLYFTGIAFIPVPNTTAAATILHVPSIVGATLEGPVVGLIVSLVFAVTAYIQFSGLFAGLSPIAPFVVLVIPRLIIPLTAWWAYEAFKKNNEYVAFIAAAVAGTLTNTILVLGLAIAFGALGFDVFTGTLLLQVVLEVIIAAVVTAAVGAAWKRLDIGRGGSSV